MRLLWRPVKDQFSYSKQLLSLCLNHLYSRMAIKKEKKNKSEQPSPSPRFNLLWLYVAIMIAFFAVTFFSDNKTNEIDWSTFRTEMLLEGHVKRVVVVNGEKVEVFIKEDKLDKPNHE